MAVTVNVRAGGSNANDIGLAPVVTVPSAATCDIGSANSNNVLISGTVSISSFGTVADRFKLVEFQAALTLQNSASLALPSGANITTAAGDTCIATSNDSGAWTVISYQRADGTALVTAAAAAPLAANLLINGGFSINQRGLSTVSNNAYDFDRWYVLTQSGAVAPSQLTNPESGAAFAARLTQSQVSAQRFGRAQVIESADCRYMRSTSVVQSGRVRMSAAGTICFAICEWTGTADSVTRDIVNNWSSSTYTPGNFFNSTTLNVLSAASLTVTANTWTPLSSFTSVSDSMNNLIVFFWTQAAQAQNVTFDLDNCKLEQGTSATAFQPRPAAQELLLCQRFYEKSFPQGTAPARAAGRTGAVAMRQTVSSNTASSFPQVRYRTAKRANPTLTLYNPLNADAQVVNLSSGTSWTSTTAVEASSEGFYVTATSAAGSQVSDIAAFHFSAEAEI